MEILLKSLKANKSCGTDNITPRMLKSMANSVSLPLANIFNHSLSTGEFPSEWKRARVVPVPKGGNAKLLSNYRPISILPSASKLLEKHAKSILEEHRIQHCPISTRQWGFMRARSTVSALIQVVDDWSKAIDNKSEVAVVFLDIRKAFDTVPHLPLLRLLHLLEINSYLLKWLKSYLLKREQFVVVNGQASTTLHAMSGVPQGSVLGPLLFIMYINNVSDVVSSDTHLNMFADDMAIYRVIKSIKDYDTLQEDINSVAAFMSGKHLQFNASKCKVMLISNKRSRSIEPPTFTVNGFSLERVETFKYLGIQFSSDLSWHSHTKALCKKSRKLVGLLHRNFATHSPPILLC